VACAERNNSLPYERLKNADIKEEHLENYTFDTNDLTLFE
jgi:hypothetical protein